MEPQGSGTAGRVPGPSRSLRGYPRCYFSSRGGGNVTILCDVDGVVADLLTEWVRRYNAKYDDDLSPEDITEWEMHRNVKPECGTDIHNFLRMPNLYSMVEIGRAHV